VEFCYYPAVRNVYLWLVLAVLSGGGVQAATPRRAAVATPATADPAEAELRSVMEDDDAAMAEIEKWLTEEKALEKQGAGAPKALVRARIERRVDGIRQSYDAFLKLHPGHIRALLALGSFLNDVGLETEAAARWEKVRELAPTHPVAWNNLANHHSHNGGGRKALEYYRKAMELAPNEALYCRNFANAAVVFKELAAEYLGLGIPDVLDRALEYYSRAEKLDPGNFQLATERAQAYYEFPPIRADEALKAWDRAMLLARTDIERQGVAIHLARVNVAAGRLAEARRHLTGVTIEELKETRSKIEAAMAQREGLERVRQ
jgi:tetratricopeptide (TPR) repeat protein